MRFSYKEILRIVFPLIISGFGQSVIYITDVLFLGRLGDTALGASAIAGLLYASLMMIGFGISSGLQVLIAQKTGEGKNNETHTYLMNGIFLQLLISAVLTSVYLLFHQIIISWFVHNENIKTATDEFLYIRITGTVPYFLFYAYRAYYLGIGKTKIISVVIIVMSVLNLILNPVLIYGYKNLVMPRGYLGSAMASVISEWAGMLFIMIFYAYGKKSVRFISWLKIKIWYEVLKLSLPLILQHFISVFSWFLFFVFIEKMGAKELAVSNIVRAVYILIMSPVLAFSHSSVTIAGQMFGAREYKYLQKTIWKVILLSAVFTLPFSMIAFIHPQWLMGIFTNDSTLINEGIPVMKIVSFALMYFAVSLPWLSALTGIGKTTSAFIVELISFVAYTAVSYYFVFVLLLPLRWVWMNEFVYFSCIMGLSYVLFLKSIKLKS